ncbi:MAG: TonB-dependent receptor [Pseudomonadota bacterium]
MRISPSKATVCACITGTISVISSQASSNEDEAKYNFNIPQLSVYDALNAIANRSRSSAIFPYDQANKLTANKVRGRYSLDEALSLALDGTGLTAHVTPFGAITIVANDESIREDSMRTKSVLLGAASTVIAGAIAATTARAQVDQIIVSATKREETLQQVPVSVSAVTAADLNARGALDLADVSLYVPNFEYSDASILPNLYVRGIGSGTTHSIEQSVGRFIDEVYIGRAAINLHPLLDVSNVEVLRGPQGTLFGKNTLGGAVIIRTADPTQEHEGSFSASYSDFSTVGNQYRVEGYVSGPISDQLSFRIAGLYRDRDGYIENLLDEPNGGTREDWALRGKLLYEGESTTVNLKNEHYEYTEEGQTPSVTVSSNGDNTEAGDDAFEAIVPSFDFVSDQWISYIDCTAELGPSATRFCPNRIQNTDNFTLKVEQEIGNVGTLTSVTGYQNYSYVHNFVAIDQGIVGGALRATRAETYDGFTQELRFTSTEFDKFDYIFGGYYENSNLERLQPSDFNVPAFIGGGPFFTEREDWVQDTETIALFGQFRYHLTEDITAIVGGRWSYEKKEFLFELASVPYQDDVNLATDEIFDESRTENRFTPAVTVRWEPTDSLNLYGTFSQGHKTGGFSDRVQDPLEFDSEKVNSYEIGAKGVFLDGSLSANIALFYMDIKDLQVARALPGLATDFEVRNAAEATSKGVELDAQWAINHIFTLGGNFAYTDAAYDDFPGASTGCPIVGGTLVDPMGDMLCNYAGIPLIYAPEIKGAAYLQFNQDDAFGKWGVSGLASISFSSEFYPEINYIETLRQPAYQTVDASITLHAPNDAVNVSVIGRNLTEEFVRAWGLQAGFTEYVAPNAPREIQVRATVNF